MRVGAWAAAAGATPHRSAPGRGICAAWRSDHASCSCPPGNTLHCAAMTPAAGGLGDNRTGNPSPAAPHCAGVRERKSRSAGTGSGTSATQSGFAEPTGATRSTPEPAPPPAPCGTNLRQSESAAQSGLLKTQVLAMDTDAVNPPLGLPERPKAVEVGQGVSCLPAYSTHRR